MKLKLYFSLFALFLASAFLFRTHAATQVGVVQGLVSSNGNAVDGAAVTVTCDGNVQNDTTDSSGFYFVQYPSGQCEAGDTANVFATKDGQSGSNSGTMQNAGATAQLVLDIGVVHVALVPEFGLITGALSLIASAGSAFFLRRKLV